MPGLGPDDRAIPGRPDSLIGALARTVQRRRDETAYRHLVDGTWHSTSWGEVGGLVVAAAAALEARGLGPGRSVLLVSGGGLPAWLAELSALACGATATTVSSDLDADALAAVVALAEPTVVLTDADATALLGSCTPPATDVGVGLAMRAGVGGDLPALRLVAEISPGTPGLVAVSHAQLTYQGAALQARGVVTARDTVLVPAPSSDPVARALLTAQVMSGAQGAVTGLGDPLAGAYRDIEPTVSGFASATSDRFRHALLAYDAGGGPWSDRPLLTIASALSLMTGDAVEKLPELGVLRGFFGGRLDNLVVDLHDSPLTLSVLRILGLPVLRATCSPLAGGLLALDDPGDRHWTSAGQPLPQSSVRVDGDGQLLVTGPGVAPGWQPTGLTGQILISGRLKVTPVPDSAWAGPVYPPRAGVGARSGSGRLRLAPSPVPRVPPASEPAAAGPVLEPEILEPEVVRRRPRADAGHELDQDTAADELSARFVRLCAPASRLFTEDRCGVRVGLVCLDGEGLLRWARTFQVAGDDFATIAASNDCHAFVEACVAALNGRLAASERIADFAIIDHPLSDPAIPAERFLDYYRVLVDQLIGGLRPALTVVPEPSPSRESPQAIGSA